MERCGLAKTNRARRINVRQLEKGAASIRRVPMPYVVVTLPPASQMSPSCPGVALNCDDVPAGTIHPRACGR
jgi:hypothetical protein